MKPYPQMHGVYNHTCSICGAQTEQLLALIGGWTIKGSWRSAVHTDSRCRSLCWAGYRSGCYRWTRLWSFPKRLDLDFRKTSPSFLLKKKK